MDGLPSCVAIKNQVFNSIYYKPASSNYWQACFSVNYMWYLRLRLCSHTTTKLFYDSHLREYLGYLVAMPLSAFRHIEVNNLLAI